ncbi:MAG: flippase-like domain-containing protein [Aquificae bacterium]|nr:flippase-like domain-containing protein [Aquificota bacterium]
MRKTFIYGSLLLLFILLISFSYILLKTFTKETFSVLLGLKKRYLLLSLLFLFLYHTFDNLRLYILSRAVNLRYSILYGYVMSFVNTFGATVTPAHVGGELAAVYMLLRKGASIHKVMSIVTMKTISGLSFFVLGFPFFVYHLYKNPEQVVPVLEIFGAVVLVFGAVYFGVKVFIQKNRKRPSVRKFRESLKRYVNYIKIFGYKKRGFLLASVASSVALYISFLLIAPALAKAFGKEEGFFELFFAQISLLYAIFMSPTPGGSGVGELGGLAVFEGFMEPFELGIFVILWRLISQYISALVGGVLFGICLLKDLRG